MENLIELSQTEVTLALWPPALKVRHGDWGNLIKRYLPV